MELENFIDDYYYELRGSASYAHYRRPIISIMPNSSSRTHSVMMPFFDMETEEYLEPTKDVEEKEPFKMKQKLEEVYRHGGEDVEDLHLTRTLDQSYYMSLSDSTDIKNQVVFRYTKSRSQFGYNSNPSKDNSSSNMMHLGTTETSTRENPASVAGQPGKNRKAKLLMVNQMWLWKLDEHTILTSFPDRWSQVQDDDLMTYILRSLARFSPTTTDSMLNRLLNLCARYIDLPSNASLDDNCFDIFEQSIATIDNLSTTELGTEAAISDPGTEARRRLREAARNEVSNISDEVKYLWEIKDNRDELKMIDRVLEDQSHVLNKYYENLTFTSTSGIGTLQELAYSRDKVQRLLKEAEDVEASLNPLLDLKQKRSNLYEAVDT
ncbi:hypothetical protein VM1G_10037 [Cytospora mali]|uniref:Uncharacterized protein n=1 Tax=Cytospora mali TaxID=578113 RepID=A0A194WCW2_CYTMA|nr:hypothetical protein VM1G_10037 [Valsa mali]